MAVQPWGEQEFGAARPPVPGPPAMPYPAMPPAPVPQVAMPQAAMPQSAMRAATADRERTVDVLKAAFAEGRLSAAEYGERFEAASGAQTYGQLARLVADLPAGPMVAPQMTAPQMMMPVPATFLPPPVMMPPPRPTNGAAVASLVLSLLGMGLPAVVAGHIAKNQIPRRNEDGDGMATFGLVLGYVECFFWTLLMFAVVATGG
ncbi:DUF1707 and DUF4190 domain-containing protein [Kitasatospora sp. NPDC094019]|uniref:DUF1707 and DUF4190 domain-containing protein n=1 Tax=Kitasatospora sp. NPDC094019 TaxID=3364091 RepID=UPI003800597C